MFVSCRGVFFAGCVGVVVLCLVASPRKIFISGVFGWGSEGCKGCAKPLCASLGVLLGLGEGSYVPEAVGLSGFDFGARGFPRFCAKEYPPNLALGGHPGFAVYSSSSSSAAKCASIAAAVASSRVADSKW